jgi:hypothetical protein
MDYLMGNNYMCRRKINDGLGQSKFRIASHLHVKKKG